MKKISNNNDLAKNLILFLAFIACSFTGNSQNWSPIQQGEKYNFGINDSFPIATIWIDSTSIENQDTILYLNKYLKECPNCMDSTVKNVIKFYILNQPSFFLSKIVVKENTSYQLTDDNTTQTIWPMAKLNESWLFDSLSNITAEVVKVSDSTIFNVPDSIKTIKLSNSDSIIISQNHGILKFPYGENQHIKLMGIEGRNIGYVTPTFHDFFNFHVGDTFEYYTKDIGRHHDTYIELQYKIVEKDSSQNEIKYIIAAKSRNRTYAFQEWEPIIYLQYTDTLIFTDSTQHFLNKNVNELLDGVKCGHKFKPILLDFDSTFNTATKYYQWNTHSVYSHDTIAATNDPNECTYHYAKTYGKGIGLLSDYEFEWHGYGESIDKKLVGYVSNGVKIGVISADSIFVGINHINILDKIKVFPNPAKNIIELIIPDDLNSCYTIAIFNIAGQPLKEERICTKKHLFNIADLPKGIYFLRISQDSQTAIKKIVKM